MVNPKNTSIKEIKMKYNVEVIIKKVINLTVDADNEETASEIAYEELSHAYDLDTYYEIQAITRGE
jgi:phosphoribosylformylglycinamidine (FGAM) synthase PurS component